MLGGSFFNGIAFDIVLYFFSVCFGFDRYLLIVCVGYFNISEHYFLLVARISRESHWNSLNRLL
jgi:hypothetical protein